MPLNNSPFLDAETILVRTTRDHRQPPTAVRGSLRVKPSASGEPSISVVVDLPEMFTAPAHQAVILLDSAAVSRIQRNPLNGQLECTIDYDFVEETQDRSPVSPNAQGGQPKPQASDRPHNSRE